MITFRTKRRVFEVFDVLVNRENRCKSRGIKVEPGDTCSQLSISVNNGTSLQAPSWLTSALESPACDSVVILLALYQTSREHGLSRQACERIFFKHLMKSPTTPMAVLRAILLYVRVALLGPLLWKLY